ncbi:MAG: DUF3054 domain-containing protein [Dermatophilaceae bacterium]
MHIARGLALDTALIVLFAAIGRRNHVETGAWVDVLGTAWPFLAGMAVGWLLSLALFRRAPLGVREGVPVWLSAVALGMALRAMTHEGTAVAFVVVATLFLGASLLGWRWASTLTARRRA